MGTKPQLGTPETSAEQKAKVQGEECVHSDPRHLEAKVKTQSAMWQHTGDNSTTFPGKQASYFLTWSTKLCRRCTLCWGNRGRGGVLNWTEPLHRYVSSHSFVPVFLVCNQTADKKKQQSAAKQSLMLQQTLLSDQGSKGHCRGAVHKLASVWATLRASQL